MAVTWKVESLESAVTEGSLSDVVKIIRWNAIDSETVSDVPYKGSRAGAVGIAAADAGDFIAYADITEANAIAWTKAALGADEVTAIEADIAAQITESKTPTSKIGVPW
jgi:hypothetical protein